MSQSVKMFFQVLLPHTLQLGKLEIPEKFVLLYGEKFLSGNSIAVMVPNGDTWPMSLEKDNGSMRIGDGWAEFAKHYSLGAMDFIMFKYKYHRHSVPVFNVLILKDSTNMEISRYPAKRQPSSSHLNGRPAFFEKRQSIHKAGRHYLGVPLAFLRKAGLCNKSRVLLKGDTGKEWVVKLKHRVRDCPVRRGRAEYKRYHLGRGWKAFREDNDIDKTDNLKFQHIGGRVIAVTKVV